MTKQEILEVTENIQKLRNCEKVKDILWDYIPENDLPEINERIQKEVA